MKGAVAILLVLFIFSCNKEDENSIEKPAPLTAYVLTKPDGFSSFIVPEDNPLTVEGVALGRKLFYDPMLSRDNSISCGSCHIQSLAFTDGKPKSIGIENSIGFRSSMSLTNMIYASSFNWDGSAMSIVGQVLLPITAPHEMDLDTTSLINRVKNHPFYAQELQKVFGLNSPGEINTSHVFRSLAQFVMTLISSDSKLDKVLLQNDPTVFFTASELRGYNMFFDNSTGPVRLKDAECGHCHTLPTFRGNDFINNGLDEIFNLNDFADKGHGRVSGNIQDNGRFVPPTLRNIELTAPYMHDGRFATLEEVLDHYATGGHYADNLDPLIYPTGLNAQEKQDIIAFLKTLTDTTFVKNPAFSNPF